MSPSQVQWKVISIRLKAFGHSSSRSPSTSTSRARPDSRRSRQDGASPGPAADMVRGETSTRNLIRVEAEMTRTILVSIALIAFTDVALQLDNALAISSVASTVPSSYRLAVLAG